jgi:xanthine dehydrogenase accessory factor
MERAAELARSGEPFALATVVWRRGPSSGKQGSRAIITAAGEVHGWIGGACAEPSVIRQAREVIAAGEPRLLLLGDAPGPEPDSSVARVPIACQSEGALEVFIEPVLPAPHLVVVGRSPMAHALADMARVLGWRAEVCEPNDLSAGQRSMVVVATQGQGDEEAIERAIAARPAYLGLVGSRKRGAAVLGYLAERGADKDLLDRVQVPAGMDLGATSHAEIAVAILAELVRLRANGKISAGAGGALAAAPAEAVDPVCGMTVAATAASLPFEHAGVTYYFCSAGCRSAFEREKARC